MDQYWFSICFVNKKAFDLVDSNLLIYKLKLYGFSDTAISLISNYFLHRTQQVKLDKNHNGKLDKQDFKLLRMKKEGVLDSIKSGVKKVMDKVAPGDDNLLKNLEETQKYHFLI